MAAMGEWRDGVGRSKLTSVLLEHAVKARGQNGVSGSLMDAVFKLRAHEASEL